MKKNYYEIDEKIYQRFDQKNDMFCRYLWDKSLRIYQNNFAIDMLKNIKKHTEGYTHFDYAFSKASWTVYNRFPFAFSWVIPPDSKEVTFAALYWHIATHWPQPIHF
ncbi:putative reductive dehalogenase (rdhA) [marine sediment metagenome]|uniref:Putative reductive dehalogenase (RdhA) n=1 Tax=marine sediment metagenome TaxID=412755 RepID=X1H9A8_9ZZZZ